MNEADFSMLQTPKCPLRIVHKPWLSFPFVVEAYEAGIWVVAQAFTNYSSAEAYCDQRRAGGHVLKVYV